MNTLKHQIAIVLLCISLGSCAQSWENKSIKGTGNETTTTVNTSDYDEVKVVGSMDVTLVKGDEGTIKLTTDENLHEYIKITSENKVLTIAIKNNIGWLKTKKGINVEVPFRDLTAITLTGSGDIVGKDTIEAEDLEINITGSGDVNLDVNATRVDAKLTGSGDGVLKGETTYFEVKVSGSGDFDATRLKSENTEAFVSGSGEASVYASKTLKARVNGSGDIAYAGNPEKVDSKISGSGDIESRN